MKILKIKSLGLFLLCKNNFLRCKFRYFNQQKVNALNFCSSHFIKAEKVRNIKLIPRVEPVTMKIDTPEFHALFTPELKKLNELFIARGFELRMAGGAVRDILLNIQPHDIDFATTATPEQMKTMFTEEGIRMFNTKGESHGTISVRVDDKENFEITTLRIDVTTDGRHAKVEFVTDWHLDAGRRDLTINSLFLGLDGTLYDYFNGVEDLSKKVIKFVGDPVQRIKEDYLRILRYFRFYGRIVAAPNDHDPETLKAIKENADGLAGISGERIWSELRKTLSGNHKYDLLMLMIDLRVALHAGIPITANVNEFNEFRARAEKLDPHPVTILLSLLNTENEMTNLHARLKFSGYERDLGYFIHFHRHQKPAEPLQHYQELILETIGKPSDLAEWVQELLKYKGETKLLLQLQDWTIPKFPVNGRVLVSLGIPGGRRFNMILQALKKKWIKSGFTLTEEKLLEQLEGTIHEVNAQHPPAKRDKKRNEKKIK